MMTTYPQVILFGSIGGDWRKNHVIPVLEELGITYFDPTQEHGWTKESGDYEAEVMARCETIVMICNKSSPSFTSLAETGWAALGAVIRKQNFILQIDLDYTIELPKSIRDHEDGKEVEGYLKHWVRSSRYMVYKHAKEFDINTMHVVEDIDGVLAALQGIYRK